MFVKICGLRDETGIEAAVSAAADAVGFVLTKSIRQVAPETASRLRHLLPDHILTVGIVSDIPADEAAGLVHQAGLGALQLHGAYPTADFVRLADSGLRLIRATALAPDTNVTAGAYGEEILLLDSTQAGSGQRWDLGLLRQFPPRGHWLLAGGLTPENVTEAITLAQPWGVDVSSGVESSRGVKSPEKIRAFVACARAAGLSGASAAPPSP